MQISLKIILLLAFLLHIDLSIIQKSRINPKNVEDGLTLLENT